MRSLSRCAAETLTLLPTGEDSFSMSAPFPKLGMRMPWVNFVPFEMSDLNWMMSVTSVLDGRISAAGVSVSMSR